ncbi:MAG: HYR domain-containing protein, partial [Bacteroidales bacterium]|nr:HYR domain-containing protein [Bacteroidales bacterium]
MKINYLQKNQYKFKAYQLFIKKITSSFVVFSLVLMIGLIFISSALKAQNPMVTFAQGSYIIDVGSLTQTNANGLKPYGLLYQLITVDGIPVSWAINSSKAKDGVDFTAEGKDYRGGPFIISAEHVNAAIITKINTWKAKGVIVDGPMLNSFSAPVFHELTSWPRAVIDDANDQLIEPFYTYAEIPSSSYLLGANPSLLNNCGDIYVLPHADPDDWTSSWLTGLKDFVNNGGYLWTGCHAVSVLENLPGCNFLSVDGLINYNSHSNGTVPFTYNNHGDPIMQFIGTMDAATQNSGSERIYLPKPAGWRPTTKLAVVDPDHPQTGVGKISPGPALACTYGHAFGDVNKGMVMYQAGHNVSSSGASSVAFGRAYFNFLLLGGVQKEININLTYPTSVSPNTTYNFSAVATGGIAPYTYQWSVQGGGSFSNTNTSATTYTTPSEIVNIVVKLEVTDACGRKNFVTVVLNQGVTVNCLADAVQPTPPVVYCGPGNTNPILFTDLAVSEIYNPLNCEGTKTFTWKYIDCGGFTRYWSYIYTIKDLIPPTGTAPADITNLECVSQIPPADASAITDEADNCGGVVNVSVSDINNGGAGCNASPFVVTRTFTLTDCGGNTTNLVQTITVKDLTPPSINCFADIFAQTATGLCSATVNITAPTTSDNCGVANVSGTRSDLLALNALYPVGVTTITWTATDNCGLTSVCTQLVTVNAPPDAVNDNFSSNPVNSYSGGSAGNVLLNDLLNCQLVDYNDVDITLIDNGGISGASISNEGILSIPPQTPAGSYTLSYQICDVLIPANCDNALITVVVNAAPILAVNDFASGINGTSGAVNALNVFDNDLLNGVQVIPAQVLLTLITPNANLVLNPDGSVDVLPFTPGGTYTLTYQICEALNPANCSQAIVSVQVIPTSDIAILKSQINPSNLPVGTYTNLLYVTPSQITAGTKIYYFLKVDNYGPNNSINALITDNMPAGISNAEYSLNLGNSWFPWNGTRLLLEFLYPGYNTILIRGDVAQNATGSLTNTATIYSPVTLDPNTANNESTVITNILQSADLSLTKQVINSPILIGGQIVYQINVFNNGPSSATNVVIQDIIDPLIISNTEYSVDGGANWLSPWTGSLNIGSLNSQATYSVRIRGTVVDATPNPNVNPIPNTAVVSSDVNDPNPGNNTVTIMTPLNEEADVSIVKTGPASVVAGLPIQYTITVTNNSNTFDADNVIVQDIINLTNITNVEFSYDGGTNWYPWLNQYIIGTLTPLQSVQILIRGEVLSSVTANIPNTAVVETDTPDPDQSNNTSTVLTPVQIISDLYIVKIQIDPADLPLDSAAIFGNPFDYVIDPVGITAGDSIYYVLFYGNNGPSDATNVIIDDVIPSGISGVVTSRCQFSFAPWSGSGNLGSIITGGGCVLVIKGIVNTDASGTLTNTAIISNSDGITDPDLANNTSTFNTPVQAQADLAIQKTVDNSTPYVGNDVTFTITVNNNGPNSATNVSLYDLLPNGYTYVSHNTASGSYSNITGVWNIGNVNFPGSVSLTITATVNLPGVGVNYLNSVSLTTLDQLDPDPSNNSDDEITYPINVIVANDDSFGPVNGYTGANNVLNVFGNDLLNGSAVVPANLILTETLPEPSGYLTLNTDGSVDVTSGTPAGTYTLTYQICEIINLSNCDDAIVSITVVAAPIDAVNDFAMGINGYTGGVAVVNVFGNDMLNNSAVIPSEVILTETIAEPNGFLTLNPNGTVDVASGTPAGTYYLTYQICEIINPSNCDDALVSITVDASPIVAVNDFATGINGYNGGAAVVNVFDNDLLNNTAVIASEVILTETIAEPNGYLTLNANGTVDVSAGTPAGTYYLTYQICEVLNPSNCDDAIVSIGVMAAPIIAFDDFESGINGFTGATNVLNVFENDILNGLDVIPSEVILSEIVADPSGSLTLNPDGSVDVAAGTPEGFYTLTYQICEVLNPSNCDIADVNILVTAAVIIANDDNFSSNPMDCENGGISGNVLANDLLDAAPVNFNDVTISITNNGGIAGASIAANGNLNIPAGVAVGTYTLSYQICEVINPANCDEADITVLINDTVNPEIICAADVNVNVDPASCEASGVSITPPQTDDNCGVMSLIGVRSDNLPLSAPYPLGLTTITWTVTDFGNNTATCNQTVTVTDNELPTISCAVPAVSYNTDLGVCTYTVTTTALDPVTTGDNCSVTSVVNDYNG